MSSVAIHPFGKRYQLRQAELLAKTLIRLGLVARRKVKEALREVRRRGGEATAFGAQLVAWGCLGRESLQRAEALLRRSLWICPRCLKAQRASSACEGCGALREAHPEPPGDGLAPGMRLGGYLIVGQIGRGGMGAVYQAYDPKMDREVALKVYTVGLDDKPERADAFMREARLLARLSHPSIIPVHALGRIGNRLYFTMDLVRGTTLRRKLQEGSLTPVEAARIALKLADALAYIHEEGLVHRDVNPRNVLVGERGEPVLIDFGIACPTDGTAGSPVIGTPAYMPPEEAAFVHQMGAGTPPGLDPRGDVYSLGATLYQALVGQPPFRLERGEGLRELLAKVVGDPPRRPCAVNPQIPRDAEAIVQKAMAKHRDQRYPTADALRDDLLRLLVGEPVQARRSSLTERIVRRVRGQSRRYTAWPESLL